MKTREERELHDAQSALKRSFGTTSAAIAEAFDRLHTAERALARSRGEQYAVPVDLGAEWDTGAPLPHLIAGNRTFVVCQARDAGPHWDGTHVNVISPSDTEASPLLILEFEGCREVRMGGPNDEALWGHPLHGRGLEPYGASEVHNSAWIEQVRQINSVHPHHSDETFRRLKHYVLAFHDEMVETLCRSIRVVHVEGSLRQGLTNLVEDLTR